MTDITEGIQYCERGRNGFIL